MQHSPAGKSSAEGRGVDLTGRGVGDGAGSRVGVGVGSGLGSELGSGEGPGELAIGRGVGE